MYNISVVLTILNEARDLSRLLDALADQSRPPDEVIVVDGGSNDGSLEILREFARAHSNLHYIVEPGVNIARGRNIGIRKSTGSVIAVTDGGCYPDRDWLKELIQPLLDNQSLHAVAGSLKVEAHTEFERLAGLLSLPPTPTNNEASAFYGRSSAFTRRLFDAVGGYPEWLYTAEDSLFSQRATELGFRIWYAKDSVLRWRPRSSFRKFSKMFFLYGRGQGRIGRADTKGAIWWLRWYGLFFASSILMVFSLWSGTIALLILGHLLLLLYRPNRQAFESCQTLESRGLLLTMLLARNLSSNLGALVGAYEYRFMARFRDELSCYSRSLADQNAVLQKSEK
jgi:glycosyltransferase involved in cell wall biosynthesis